MNTLILSYEVSGSFKKIDHEPTLYLIKNQNPTIKNLQHVDLLRRSFVEEDLIHWTKKLISKYDCIVWMRNASDLTIDFNALERIIDEDWIVAGSTKKSAWIKKEFFADKLDASVLAINCKKMGADLIDQMMSGKIVDVNFAFLSKIFCFNYKQIINIKPFLKDNRENIVLF